jgi:hypothetical protein
MIPRLAFYSIRPSRIFEPLIIFVLFEHLQASIPLGTATLGLHWNTERHIQRNAPHPDQGFSFFNIVDLMTNGNHMELHKHTAALEFEDLTVPSIPIPNFGPWS